MIQKKPYRTFQSRKAWWRWAYNKTGCKSEEIINSLNLLCEHSVIRSVQIMWSMKWHVADRGALRKKCSENMQQIYRGTPMLMCDFNKVTLNWGKYFKGGLAKKGADQVLKRGAVALYETVAFSKEFQGVWQGSKSLSAKFYLLKCNITWKN